MDKYKSVDLGGMPFVLNDFRWFLGQIVAGNQGIYAALNNLLRGFGDDFIVQGCTLGGISGTYTLTEGWIMLDGELLKVDAQTAFDEATDSKFIKVTTYDSTGDKTMRNGATAQTYQVNRGEISGTSGNLAYNGLRREQLSGAITVDGTTIGTVNTVKKIIKIGDWDMNTFGFKQVTHGVVFSSIRSISVMIINDASSTLYPLRKTASAADTTNQGGVELITSTFIRLQRLNSGDFDTASYSTTSFNRGWVTIEYEL